MGYAECESLWLVVFPSDPEAIRFTDHKDSHLGSFKLESRVRVGADSVWCRHAYSAVSAEPKSDEVSVEKHGCPTSHEGNPREVQGQSGETGEGDEEAIHGTWLQSAWWMPTDASTLADARRVLFRIPEHN